jgi:hypothetical protein
MKISFQFQEARFQFIERSSPPRLLAATSVLAVQAQWVKVSSGALVDAEKSSAAKVRSTRAS